jgi:dienelactone hydrolase
MLKMTSTNETHTSAACCSAPVPQSTTTYTTKGTTRNLAETTCYITGPTDAKKAIFFIYDVFGFQDPTWQGADVLASAGYLVIMPNFFDDNAARTEWMSLPDDKKKELFGGWLSKNIADQKPHLARLHRILDAAKKEYSSVQSWGAIGCTFTFPQTPFMHRY